MSRLVISVVVGLAFFQLELLAANVLTKSDIPSGVSPELKRLLEQTFAPNVRDRASAVKQIGEMREDAAAAVPFLIRLLADRYENDDGEIYFYVDDALLAIGQPALKLCIDAANDPSQIVQSHAMRCLTKFEAPQAGHALTVLLDSSDLAVSRYAVFCFKQRRDPQSVQPLLKLLRAGFRWTENDSSGSIRLREIVEALGFQKDPLAISELTKILRDKNQNAQIRAAAAWSLGRIGEPQSIPELCEILQDRTTPMIMRMGAVRGIGAYHPDPKISESGRTEVVLGDSNLLALIENVLNDGDEPLLVRMAAAQAIGDSNNASAVDTLKSVVNSNADKVLRFWAAVSIVKLSEGPIEKAVADAVKDYRSRNFEGPPIDQEEQRAALQKIKRLGIAKNEANPDVVISNESEKDNESNSLPQSRKAQGPGKTFSILTLILIGVAIASFALVWSVKRKRLHREMTK